MISTPITSDLVHGAAELEPTGRGLQPHRRAAWAQAQYPDPQLLAMERQPSGVRLQFRTDATRIESVMHPTRIAYRGADRPRGRTAALCPVTDAGPVRIHHGSSISRGSHALAPTDIWPVVAARSAGVEVRNLGFGGGALVDPFLSCAIRDAPADLSSVKLGNNVVNLDAMRLRAFVPAVLGSLDTIRDGHPVTPLILISPIFYGIHEDTPGPGAVDRRSLGTDQVCFAATGNPREVRSGRLTLNAIRRELQALVEHRSENPNLHYVDGTTLYGFDDQADLPLPDGLHPDIASHRRIGERFASKTLTEWIQAIRAEP